MRMKSAGTSSALAAAAGLPVRKGSIRILRPSLSTNRQAWPNQRTRVDIVALLRRCRDPRILYALLDGRRSWCAYSCLRNCRMQISNLQFASCRLPLTMVRLACSHEDGDGGRIGGADLTDVVDLVMLKDFQSLLGFFLIVPQSQESPIVFPNYPA